MTDSEPVAGKRSRSKPVPTDLDLIGALIATGLVVTLAALLVFRISDRRAKDRGLLDRTTGS